MNAFSHLAFGLTTTYLFSIAVTNTFFAFNFFSIQAIAITSLAALLPDVDLAKTRISRVLILITAILLTIGAKPLFSFIKPELNAWIAAISVSLITIALYIALKPKHRTLTHTLSFGILYTGLTLVITSSYGIALAALISFSTHLIGDLKI